METDTSKQALRREAIRRRLAHETRKIICTDLQRSTSWFDKWWAEFRHNPHSDFADRSHTPHTSPNAMPESVFQTVVEVRQTLEAATTTAAK